MDKYERFVASYLRLNGYFTVPNFIVHAGDDPERILAGRVGNFTETDILGVRMPYSREVTGKLHIANHAALIDGAPEKFDIVIAEVKSGNDNRPNRVWRGGRGREVGSYIARFVGLHSSDAEVGVIGDALATSFRFEDERCRFRFITFSSEPNLYYRERGMSCITFEEAISFIVDVRGQCWIDASIGVASSHQQWDKLLVDIFAVANRTDEPFADRVRVIESLLAT